MGTLIAFRKNRFWRIDTPSGKYAKIGDPNWFPIDGLASLGEHLYAIERQSLFRFDRDGYYTLIGNLYEYKRTTALASVDGRLFAISDDWLWEVEPQSGAYKRASAQGNWMGEVLMVGVQGRLMIIQNERLFSVDPHTGDWTALTERYHWADTTCVCSTPERMFAVSRGLLLEVRPEDGLQRPLVDARVRGEALMAANDDGLFIIHRLDLFRIDPDSGKSERLSWNRAWDQVTHLVAV